MLTDRILDRIFRRTRAKSPRRYIAPKLGVAGFFRALNAAGVSYAVLRWFESLPNVAPGEDIDILVADDGLARLDDLLQGSHRDGVPCDIYSVSGLPGTDYCGVAYFPTHLAAEILDSAILAPNGVRVPNPRHHLLTMAYHVLLHKGYLSGLAPVRGAQPRCESPEHDYPAVLAELAAKAGIAMGGDNPPTMASLTDFLATSGWRPPNDTLEKLARENNWIEDALLGGSATDPSWDGVTVFVIREQATPYLDLIRTTLLEEGFNLLHEEPMAPALRASFAKGARGGDWGCGPYPADAGQPAHILIMLDLFPCVPAPELAHEFYGLANARTYEAKVCARDAVNAQLPPSLRCNPIHSSDNPRQALDYFSLLQSTRIDQDGLQAAIRNLRSQVALPWATKRMIGKPGRHAITRVVAYDGRDTICKTFRPGHEAYLENELLARKLGEGLPEVLPILAHHGQHLLFPLGTPMQRRRFFTAREIGQLKRLILHFRKLGYELTDFTPNSVTREDNHGLRILDFESIEPAPPRNTVTGCNCWYGTARNLPAWRRKRAATRDSNYYYAWYDKTGVPRWMAARKIPSPIVPAVQLAVRSTFAAKQFAQNWRNALTSAPQHP